MTEQSMKHVNAQSGTIDVPVSQTEAEIHAASIFCGQESLQLVLGVLVKDFVAVDKASKGGINIPSLGWDLRTLGRSR